MVVERDVWGVEAGTGGVVMMISGTVVENGCLSVVAMVVMTCTVLEDGLVVVVVVESGFVVEGTRVMVMVVMAGPVGVAVVVRWAVKTVVLDTVAKVVVVVAERKRWRRHYCTVAQKDVINLLGFVLIKNTKYYKLFGLITKNTEQWELRRLHFVVLRI